jgi:formylmethanofuran dehydrogenase subunit C
VKGNASIYEAESQISAGTIEVKGDESRIYTDVSDTSTATVILSGDVQQFVNGQYKNLIVNNSGKGIQCYSRYFYSLYVSCFKNGYDKTCIYVSWC